MVESGTAPDLSGHETSYRQGYLTIVVHGKRGVSGSILPHDLGKVAQFLIEQVLLLTQLISTGIPPYSMQP